MNQCQHFTKSSLIMLYQHPGFGLFYGVACITLSLTAIIGNSIVFYAFWISKSLNHTSQMSRMLLLSLAASDLGVGLFVLPLNAALMLQMLGLVSSNDGLRDQNMTKTCPLFKAAIFVSIFFSGALLLTIGAIAIDKYLSLYLHLKYTQLVTSARIRIAVSAIWTISFLLATLETLLGLNVIINTSGMVLVIFIASIAYWKIYTIALHHQNQICVQDGQQNQICRLTHFSRAKRMAMKTSSLFFVLVICDAPSIVICPMFEYSKTPSTLLTLFFYVSSFLFISNTCLNPLVICWKIREVREIFANVFKHVFSKCIPSGNQWETDFRFKQLSMFACSYNQTAFLENSQVRLPNTGEELINLVVLALPATCLANYKKWQQYLMRGLRCELLWVNSVVWLKIKVKSHLCLS